MLLFYALCHYEKQNIFCILQMDDMFENNLRWVEDKSGEPLIILAVYDNKFELEKLLNHFNQLFHNQKQTNMGLGNQPRMEKTFVNIVGGNFAVRVTDKTPNAVKRYSEKAEKDVWELTYNFMDGFIKQLEVVKNNFGGQQLNVGIDAVGEYYELQIPVESNYFQSFVIKLKNVDFGYEVKLLPYSFESKTERNKKTGKPKLISGINIQQGGEKIPNYYTREEPHDKPQFPEGGSERDIKMWQFDNTEFLINLVKEIGDELLGGKNYSATPPPTEKKKEALGNEKKEVVPEADDLPF